MVEVVTFGCRINSYESEVLKEKLAALDNVVIVNTCAVTGEAERQCRRPPQTPPRKPGRPDNRYRLCRSDSAAQICFHAGGRSGTRQRGKAEIEKYLTGSLTEKSIVGDIFSYDDYDHYLITGFEGRQRAFVQIQQGCSHRCTYCIVPYARGNNRSVKEEDIISQIRELLGRGFGEICLTGVDACSYRPSFSGLIQHILESDSRTSFAAVRLTGPGCRRRRFYRSGRQIQKRPSAFSPVCPVRRQHDTKKDASPPYPRRCH